MEFYNPRITGSAGISGSLTVESGSIYGYLEGTASYALYALEGITLRTGSVSASVDASGFHITASTDITGTLNVTERVTISTNQQLSSSVQDSFISASLSGSVEGLGTNLFDVPTFLRLTGSIWTGSIALRDESLTITGSYEDIYTEIRSGSVIIKLMPDVTMSNSLFVTGSGSITAQSFTGSLFGLVTGSSTGSFIGVFTGSMSGSATGSFTGSVTGTFEGFSTGTFFGESTGSYTGSLLGHFSGSGTGSFFGEFTGSHTGLFTGSLIGQATGSFTGSLIGTGTGSFTGSFEGNYTGSFSGSYTGSLTGSLEGTSSWAETSSYALTSSYSLNVSPAYSQTFTVASTLWVVTHSLGTKDLVVQMYDGAGYQFLPDEIYLDTTSSAVISFAFPVTGTVVIK